MMKPFSINFPFLSLMCIFLALITFHIIPSSSDWQAFNPCIPTAKPQPSFESTSPPKSPHALHPIPNTHQ